MFDALSARFAKTFGNLRSKGKISSSDIDSVLDEIASALLFRIQIFIFGLLLTSRLVNIKNKILKIPLVAIYLICAYIYDNSFSWTFSFLA